GRYNQPGDGGETKRALSVRRGEEKAGMRGGGKSIERGIEEVGRKERRHCVCPGQSPDDSRRIRSLGTQPELLRAQASGEPEEGARDLMERRGMPPPPDRKPPHEIAGGALLWGEIAAPGSLVDR